jgi:enoyl-CoA hydratase
MLGVGDSLAVLGFAGDVWLVLEPLEPHATSNDRSNTERRFMAAILAGPAPARMIHRMKARRSAKQIAQGVRLWPQIRPSAYSPGMSEPIPAVRVETDGPVTTVILERPAVRNAVDRPTADALAAAFRRFEADADARVAVLWGAGGTFCAGADLKAIAHGRGNRVAPEGDGPMGPSRMVLDKPVIAAIAGHAVAGGLELATWCDLRVAEQDAVLGVFCRRWGVPLIDGGTVRLPRLIGHGRALDLILTGRPVHAEEALSMGLVNRVVGKGEARAAAEKLAHAIAAFPQEAMRGDRRSSYDQWNLDLAAALQNELTCGMSAINEETVQGATRFAEGAGRHGHFDE